MCRRMCSVPVRVERTGATGQNKSRHDASLATDSIMWKCQRWKSEGKKNKKTSQANKSHLDIYPFYFYITTEEQSCKSQ